MTVPNSDMIAPLLCKQNPLAVIRLVIGEIFMRSEGKFSSPSLVFDLCGGGEQGHTLFVFGALTLSKAI